MNVLKEHKLLYAVDNIMIDLSFPTMVLIEKSFPPGLVIEQVEQRRDEEEEKIKGLDCMRIHDLERLIKQPFVMEGKIHIFIRLWYKLVKNELEDHRCNAQVGIEFANYPDIEELLRIWKTWRDILGYELC